MCGAVLLTLFKINRPDSPKIWPLRKSSVPFWNLHFFSLVLSKRTNCFQSYQTQNLSQVNFFVVCIIKEKAKATSLFRNSAPIRLFLGKYGPNSAVEIFGWSLFYSAPFELRTKFRPVGNTDVGGVTDKNCFLCGQVSINPLPGGPRSNRT